MSSKPEESVTNGDQVASHRRTGTFVDSLRAVGWSFFGVRRAADHERDVVRLNPLHLVLAGVVLAGAFIAGLIVLVQWVSASGVAA